MATKTDTDDQPFISIQASTTLYPVHMTARLCRAIGDAYEQHDWVTAASAIERAHNVASRLRAISASNAEDNYEDLLAALESRSLPSPPPANLENSDRAVSSLLETSNEMTPQASASISRNNPAVDNFIGEHEGLSEQSLGSLETPNGHILWNTSSLPELDAWLDALGGAGDLCFDDTRSDHIYGFGTMPSM